MLLSSLCLLMRFKGNFCVLSYMYAIVACRTLLGNNHETNN
jgi:hypothetical protein